MDPTAPKDDQNQQDAENQQQNPVQTGGFVVSGESGSPADLAQTQQQPPNDPQNIAAPAPNNLEQQSNPTAQPQQQFAGNLQSDLQSTVEAATGTHLAGQPDQTSPPQSAAQDATLPPPPGAQQPDPTPFTPAQNPGSAPIQTPGSPQMPEQPTQDDGSGTSKMKSVIIILAVLIIVAILAAVAWYFVLNQNQTSEENSTVGPPIQTPSSPSPRTNNGFGDITDPTPEATAPAQTQEEVIDETAQDTEPITAPPQQ